MQLLPFSHQQQYFKKYTSVQEPGLNIEIVWRKLEKLPIRFNQNEDCWLLNSKAEYCSSTKSSGQDQYPIVAVVTKAQVKIKELLKYASFRKTKNGNTNHSCFVRGEVQCPFAHHVNLTFCKALKIRPLALKHQSTVFVFQPTFISFEISLPSEL